MHTILSSPKTVVLIALIALSARGQRMGAQEPPVRPRQLPAVVVSARPDPPGPRKMSGMVRDTAATPIDRVELSIPQLQRRAFSNADGTFRFDDIKPGKYEVRARRIGYAPQVQEIVVDSLGGVGVFALLPTARRLLPVVSSATRGGLSGTVGDTAYHALPGATVRVLGHSQTVQTDSAGGFFIPLAAGSYLVSVKRTGFDYKLVSVIIPPDSGRSVTVFLPPRERPVPHEEANNLEDLNTRLVRRRTTTSRVYTRADLEKMQVEWVYDAVQRGTIAAGGSMIADRDCSVIVNGGPETVELEGLTLDDIESVEIYPVAQGSRRASVPQVTLGNTRLALWRNWTKRCPLVYVWLR
ncbi:MAG TPA: carboxypeptidase regulatory-like domain-containing protein [Gemmatimonadaceae bacterium]